MLVLICVLTIWIVSRILFVAVHRYESNRRLAFILKLFVLTLSSVASYTKSRRYSALHCSSRRWCEENSPAPAKPGLKFRHAHRRAEESVTPAQPTYLIREMALSVGRTTI
jgi:hypothetical protein